MKHRLSRMLGFTMIELLVVIAVIGILAVAVLSAINPIEQINKGKDTRTRSDASELLAAVERYYSTQEMYPWSLAVTTPAWNAVTATTLAVFGDAVSEFNWVQNLTDSQEVKGQFSQRLLSSYSTVTNPPSFVLFKAADSAAVANQTHVCFIPTSQQFKIEATKKCCSSTTAGGICASAGSSVNTAPASVTGFNPCTSRDGVTTVANYICLP